MSLEWNKAYWSHNPPPWEIGRPQPVFVQLVTDGEIRAPAKLLDIGCGTGENAIYYAQNKIITTGVDFAEAALEKARTKAKERNVSVEFKVGNALALDFKENWFDYVTDSGLFHVFNDSERLRFVTEINRVLKPNGAYFMMCFSEQEPTNWGGPRRVSRTELLSAFAKPLFRLDYVRDAKFTTRIHEDGGGLAYLVKATKI